MCADFVWDDERVNMLSHMVEDGASSSHAAAQLGITRNAVIGKVHRLGLRLTGKGRARVYKPRVAKPPRQPPPPKAVSMPPVTVPLPPPLCVKGAITLKRRSVRPIQMT